MDNIKDIIIIGGGPAGVAAAVEGTSRGLDVLLIERHAIGGAISRAGELVYRGTRSTGVEVAGELIKDLERAVVPTIFADVISASLVGKEKKVKTKKGEAYLAKTVIIAGGSSESREEVALAEGISPTRGYPQTVEKDKPYVVAGASTWRFATAEALRDEGAEVILYGAEETEDLKGITCVKEPLVAVEQEGENLVLVTKEGKETRDAHLILLEGVLPASDIFIRMDLDEGFIETDARVATNIPGVFACGDILAKDAQDRTVDGACEEGALAAAAATEYLG